MTTPIFDFLLKTSGWDESCGPRPGIWIDQVAGGKTLWGCLWSYSGGMATPDQMKPAMDLDDLELAFELGDISVLAKDKNLAARANVILASASANPNDSKWRQEARYISRKYREDPPEYIYPHSPPAIGGYGGLMNLTIEFVRPGWGDVKSILEKAKQMQPRTTL